MSDEGLPPKLPARILVIDDNLDVRADFLKILSPRPNDTLLQRLGADLFGEAETSDVAATEQEYPAYQVQVAPDGKSGHEMVRAALAARTPHAVAFVDMRMPGGWDGLKTIEEIWRIQPSLQVVICTAHSDYGWRAITDRLGISDQLLILRKPFDPIEVTQLACALSAKWELTREKEQRLDDLAERVRERTAALEQTNHQLKEAMEARLRLEREIRQVQKLDALGRLAASLGHEINNPLAFIGANVEFLRRALGDLGPAAGAAGPEMMSVLDETDVGVDRIRRLVQELRSFSRTSDDTENWANLDLVVAGALRLVGNDIRQCSSIVNDVSGDLPPVKGQHHQLEQVIVNLLMNARYALTKGRANEIRIVAKRETTDRVLLEVHDTGNGIPGDDLERIFEPFFTTKPRGEGTGLGLSICREIISALGGTIDVESTVGHGTVFRIRLPVYVGERQERVPPARIPAVDTGATRARLLIVDDEPQILRSLARLLKGYDVETATGVDEALRLYSARPFALVLSDIMMGERTGADLLAGIARLGPEHAARVVFMTGGALEPWVQAFLASVTNPFVEKPISAIALREVFATHLRTMEKDITP